MIAVNQARLRHQITELMSFFHSPIKFRQQLINLFSLYANNALRLGELTQARPNTPLYNLPRPVIRQLKQDLKPLIYKEPQAALMLADELWEDNTLEVQQTAIFILSAAPLNTPEPILSRLEKWLTPTLARSNATYLLTDGTLNLQNKFPDAWESFIMAYLAQEDPKLIALGIQGLTAALQNPRFKNLPAIYRLISPIIRDPHTDLLQELELLMEALVNRSPTETALFLKQALTVSKTPNTARIIKQSLPLFSENIQQDLQSALKK